MSVANESLKRPEARKLPRLAIKARAHLRRLGLPVVAMRARQAAAAIPWAPLRKWTWRRPRALLRQLGITGPSSYNARFKEWAAGFMPKKLYSRALFIIIAPIVLLESVIAYNFMETHWQKVTRHMSETTANNIATLIEVYNNYRDNDNYSRLISLAQEEMGVHSFSVHPPGDLPSAVREKAFPELLRDLLGPDLRKRIRKKTKKKYPFHVDSVGDSKYVQIQFKLDTAILKFMFDREKTYASNSHIFLAWMIGTSIVLLTVAILFLGNQIRPILRLSEAAEAFGKGRPVPDDFRPRGAQEVRQAAQAFIDMSHRISTHVDQRTTMLAGVSHDLRSILTRFKLALTMLDNRTEAEALNSDVMQMQHILEDYLAFARGDGGEVAAPTNMRQLLEETCDEANQYGKAIELKMGRKFKDRVLTVKRQAFKRAVANLISNAARFGDAILISASLDKKWLRVAVEDNGPGIAEMDREAVFKPFYRLEHTLNRQEGHTGLGLAIARDVARSHGGDVELGVSAALGGLRATIRIPR